MTATMDPVQDTPVGYKPGDLVDLGPVNNPATTLTWDDQGVCWVVERTRRKSRRPETVPYRVVASVEDPEAFYAALDGEVPAAPTFDSDELTRVVVWLLGFHREHQPDVFDHGAWQALEEVMGVDPEATDAEVVAALEAVVALVDADGLQREGWKRVVGLISTYHASLL
jgi:hypothetical protein